MMEMMKDDDDEIVGITALFTGLAKLSLNEVIRDANLGVDPYHERRVALRRLKKTTYDAYFEQLRLRRNEPCDAAARTELNIGPFNQALGYVFEKFRCQRKFDEANKMEDLLSRLQLYEGDSGATVKSVLSMLLSLAEADDDVPRTGGAPCPILGDVLIPVAQKPNVFVIPDGAPVYGDTNVRPCRDDKYNISYTHFPDYLFNAVPPIQNNNNNNPYIKDSIDKMKLCSVSPGMRHQHAAAAAAADDDSYSLRNRRTLFGAFTYGVVATTDLNIKLEIPDIDEENLGDSAFPKYTEKNLRQHESEDEGLGTDSESVSSVESRMKLRSPFCEELDQWELALLYKPNTHYTWETRGKPSEKEQPYLTEAGPEAFDHVCSIVNGWLRLINPATVHISERIVTMSQLIKHIQYLLVGVPSETFSLNQATGKFTMYEGVKISGLSTESLRASCSEFIECGESCRKLDRFAHQTSKLSFYSKGNVFQAFARAIRRYLYYYNTAVASVPNHKTVLEMKCMLEKLMRQIGYLVGLCKLDSLGSGQESNFPTGLKLLMYLYEHTLANCAMDHYTMLLYLLTNCCVPFTVFLKDWIFRGIYKDAFNEFMIKMNEDHLYSRDKFYWTHGYELLPDETSFLGKIMTDIYLCGKSVNLLTLCCPDHFLAKSHQVVPPVYICFSEQHLSTINSKCRRYVTYMENEASDRVMTRVEMLKKAAEKKKMRVMEARKEANLLVHKVQAKNLEKRKAADAKKRAEFAFLKRQMEKDLVRRASAQEKEKEDDIAIMAVLTEQEDAVDPELKRLQEEAKEELVEKYRKLMEEAELREQRALWKVKRAKLAEARRQFFESDKLQHDMPDYTVSGIEPIDVANLPPWAAKRLTDTKEDMLSIENSEVPVSEIQEDRSLPKWAAGRLNTSATITITDEPVDGIPEMPNWAQERLHESVTVDAGMNGGTDTKVDRTDGTVDRTDGTVDISVTAANIVEGSVNSTEQGATTTNEVDSDSANVKADMAPGDVRASDMDKANVVSFEGDIDDITISQEKGVIATGKGAVGVERAMDAAKGAMADGDFGSVDTLKEEVAGSVESFMTINRVDGETSVETSDISISICTDHLEMKDTSLETASSHITDETEQLDLDQIRLRKFHNLNIHGRHASQQTDTSEDASPRGLVLDNPSDETEGGVMDIDSRADRFRIINAAGRHASQQTGSDVIMPETDKESDDLVGYSSPCATAVCPGEQRPVSCVSDETGYHSEPGMGKGQQSPGDRRSAESTQEVRTHNRWSENERLDVEQIRLRKFQSLNIHGRHASQQTDTSEDASPRGLVLDNPSDETEGGVMDIDSRADRFRMINTAGRHASQQSGSDVIYPSSVETGPRLEAVESPAVVGPFMHDNENEQIDEIRVNKYKQMNKHGSHASQQTGSDIIMPKTDSVAPVESDYAVSYGFNSPSSTGVDRVERSCSHVSDETGYHSEAGVRRSQIDRNIESSQSDSRRGALGYISQETEASDIEGIRQDRFKYRNLQHGHHPSEQSENVLRFDEGMARASTPKTQHGRGLTDSVFETPTGSDDHGPVSHPSTESEEMSEAVRLNRFKTRNKHGSHPSASSVEKLLYGAKNDDYNPSPLTIEENDEEFDKETDEEIADAFISESGVKPYHYPDIGLERMGEILKEEMTRSLSSPVPEIEHVDTLRYQPLDSLMNKCLAPPIFAQISLVNRSLLNYFFNELEIDRHFEALRMYLFLEDGEFGQTLSDSLFERLSTDCMPHEVLNPVSLNRILTKALRSSIHAENTSLTENISFRVKYIPAILQLNTASAINCLDLQYKVKWPLNIVITDNCLDKYNRVFTFMLQMKRISWIIKDIWHRLKHDATVNDMTRSVQFRHLQTYRHEMDHFVHTMQGYLSTQVIHVTWKQFQEDLDNNVQNLDDLHERHSEYLNKAIFRCLLNTKAAPIMKVIQDIFNIIIRFRSQIIWSPWKLKNDQMVHAGFLHAKASYKSFKQYSTFLFQVVKKLTLRGYQQIDLQELLLRLNYNNYYMNDA
ncbi:gamma-tubulin complex component 6-like [Tubulanus polymorphus]|uniref:gamma-tubulin complex component 6-like n=1 Tax=Tubulanus polymorphus TaxID=672921 RepID=UPI003DA5A5AF